MTFWRVCGRGKRSSGGERDRGREGHVRGRGRRERGGEATQERSIAVWLRAHTHTAGPPLPLSRSARYARQHTPWHRPAPYGGGCHWPPVTRNAVRCAPHALPLTKAGKRAARASILALARPPLSFRGTHRNFEDVLLAGSGLLFLCRRRLHLCAPVIEGAGGGVSPHCGGVSIFFISRSMVIPATMAYRIVSYRTV